MFEWFGRMAFDVGLRDTEAFQRYVRGPAYVLAYGDPERVHELALKALNDYKDVLKDAAREFNFPDLHVNLAGRSVMPFGTAAGLDKNCDAVEPLSHIFGFQEVGTIIVNPREGNKKPRVAVGASGDLWNAQGFPSKGLQYAKEKLRAYGDSGGDGIILASICGVPTESNALDVAYGETKFLLEELEHLVDGFVWNPFSPNTEALAALRTSETFELYAKLVKSYAGTAPALVKMGPYEPGEKQQWMDLVGSWMQGGGDGIVAVNTKMVPKEIVPVKDWGYKSAGRSGEFLQQYRQRAVRDVRAAYPKATIIATGGIDSAEQAWNAFEAGADALEGYTPYTYKGFGLLLEMATGLRKILSIHDYKSLKHLQAATRINGYVAE